MLSSWLRRRQARSSAPKRRRPAGFRPRLECLEDRTVPATPAGYMVSLMTSAPTVAFGQPFTLTAAVSGPPNGPLPGGDVVFLDGGTTTLGQVPVPQGGNATFQATLAPALAVGSHDLTAVYQATQPAGAPVSVTSHEVTETITPASVPQPVQAPAAPQLPTAITLNLNAVRLPRHRIPIVYGGRALHIAATVHDSQGGLVEGVVLLFVSRRTAGTRFVGIGGDSSTLPTVELPSGAARAYGIEAIYLGDATHLPSIAATEVKVGNGTTAGIMPKPATIPLLPEANGTTDGPGRGLSPGHAELAVYRPSTGQWFIGRPSGPRIVPFGGPGDVPAPADYDGAGHAEFAVYRPGAGQWFIMEGRSGLRIVPFGGGPGDIPVPADYDGVGHAEFAVYRPSTGQWFIEGPSGPRIVPFGGPGDVPAPADYDGVGHAEFAVYRPGAGQWLIMEGRSGLRIVPFGGGPDDIPAPAAY